jgi:hypothetical protein
MTTSAEEEEEVVVVVTASHFSNAKRQWQHRDTSASRSAGRVCDIAPWDWPLPSVRGIPAARAAAYLFIYTQITPIKPWYIYIVRCFVITKKRVHRYNKKRVHRSTKKGYIVITKKGVHFGHQKGGTLENKNGDE